MVAEKEIPTGLERRQGVTKGRKFSLGVGQLALPPAALTTLPRTMVVFVGVTSRAVRAKVKAECPRPVRPFRRHLNLVTSRGGRIFEISYTNRIL